MANNNTLKYQEQLAVTRATYVEHLNAITTHCEEKLLKLEKTSIRIKCINGFREYNDKFKGTANIESYTTTDKTKQLFKKHLDFIKKTIDDNKNFSNLTNYLIACLVTKGVIVIFKIVDIQYNQRKRIFISGMQFYFIFQ